MNAPLRRVGVVVLVLFALLFVNLNWVQGYKADDYRTSRYNGRVQLTDYERQRGTIYDANGAALATSVATSDQLKYLRTYPGGPAFEPILGYKPVNLGSTGIEDAMDVYLAGNASSDDADQRSVLRSSQPGRQRVPHTGQERPGHGVQRAEEQRIAGRCGRRRSPWTRTPARSWRWRPPRASTATSLASHKTSTAAATYKRLNSRSGSARCSTAPCPTTAPPGSTFKVDRLGRRAGRAAATHPTP